MFDTWYCYIFPARRCRNQVRWLTGEKMDVRYSTPEKGEKYFLFTRKEVFHACFTCEIGIIGDNYLQNNIMVHNYYRIILFYNYHFVDLLLFSSLREKTKYQNVTPAPSDKLYKSTRKHVFYPNMRLHLLSILQKIVLFNKLHM